MFLRSVRVPNHTLQRRLALVPAHSPYLPGCPQPMLTEIYIEALLVDEQVADQVWEARDAGVLTDGAACIAWLLIAG